MKDPIVQEVRDARAAIAAEFDYDLSRIFAWARAKEANECKSVAFPQASLPVEVGNGSGKGKLTLIEFLLLPTGAAPDVELDITRSGKIETHRDRDF